MVALGLLAPLAGLDNFIDGAMRDSFGISTGLLLSGTVAALVYAYAVRFLAISAGGVDAGLDQGAAASSTTAPAPSAKR